MGLSESDKEMDVVFNTTDALRKAIEASNHTANILMQTFFPATMNQVRSMLRGEHHMVVKAGIG